MKSSFARLGSVLLVTAVIGCGGEELTDHDGGTVPDGGGTGGVVTGGTSGAAGMTGAGGV